MPAESHAQDSWESPYSGNTIKNTVSGSFAIGANNTVNHNLSGAIG
jgi:hypothetical protein